MFALSSLYGDYTNILGGSRCDICLAEHCTGMCLYSCTEAAMLKLLKFRYYLKCRRQALDNLDESYMLPGDYVPDDWDEDIKFLGDGPPCLNEKVLAKYYNELARLDEEDMLVGDYKYWDGFRKWGFYPLERVIETDFSPPVDLNCGPILPSDENSTVEEESKMYEGVITMELNEEMVINENESSMHSLDFIDCLEIDFVIRPNEVVKVFIVEFDLDRMRWFYVDKGKDEFWRSNEEWIRAKRIKLG